MFLLEPCMSNAAQMGSGFIWFVWETKRKGHTQAPLMAVVGIACLEYTVKIIKESETL